MGDNRGLKYTVETLTPAVQASISFSGVLRYLGLKQAGGTQAHIARRIRQLGIDHSHFHLQGHNKGKPSPRRKHFTEFLVIRPEGSLKLNSHKLRRAMYECGFVEECAECGAGPVWRGEPIRLHIDHINGNPLDNRRENVRFLCPNCHAQTPTYCAGNKNAAARGRSPIGQRPTV